MKECLLSETDRKQINPLNNDFNQTRDLSHEIV